MSTQIEQAVRHPQQEQLGTKLPLLYEDDKEADLGESFLHGLTDEVLNRCLVSHFSKQPGYRVFSNLNLYYQPFDSIEASYLPYVSPDTMVVNAFHPLGENPRSYEIGKDGPAPEVTIEILSERSFEQRDLDEKVILYAKLKVHEYILVDVTGEFLPQRLLLKRLHVDGNWQDLQDADRGITSELGFRIAFGKNDDRLYVFNVATGQAYVHPEESEERVRSAEAHAKRTEARMKKLENELAQLRGKTKRRKSK